MSASGHIQPRLFHGSHHYFSEGETIKPSELGFHKAVFEDPTPRVYLSSSIDEAKKYASLRVESKHKLFGPIYEVDSPEAVPMLEDFKKQPQYLQHYKSMFTTTYSSTSNNLVPKKIVGWALNPNIDQ